jgi:ABC-type lipoprotein release transport system permease subunit
LVVLVLIVALVSTLFLVTALSFLSFYRGFNGYLGEQDGVVAVYDGESSTPFTGFVPAYFTEHLLELDGVLSCSPETITPCVIVNQEVLFRGIVPEVFFKVNPVLTISGSELNQSCLNGVVLGKNLADRLNVDVGSSVLVFSALTNRYLCLHVVGVFDSGSCMDDEALVLLSVGQSLRFSDYNRVTLIRVQFNQSIIGPEHIYQELAKQTLPSPSSSPSPTSHVSDYFGSMSWSIIKFQSDKISVKDTEDLMKGYLTRYGVTKEALIVLSVLVFVFSAVTVIVASQTLLRQHKSELETLRSVGASVHQIKLDLFCKLLPLSVVSSLLGVLFAGLILTLLEQFGVLIVLTHRIAITFDPIVLLMNFVLTLVLTSISVWRVRV